MFPGYPPPPGPGGPYFGYPPPSGYPYAPNAAPRPPAGTSGFAVASLIFGILGGVLFGIVFGILALVRIRANGQSGKGMAIAGLVLSGVWLTVLLGGAAAGIVERVRNADDTAAGTNQTFRPGDCLNDLRGTMPRVTCEKPHEGEVFAVVTLPSGPWPGEGAVTAQVESLCSGELVRYASDPHASFRLKFVYLYPDEQMWRTDRTAVCIAKDPAGPMTGSLHD